MRAGKFKFSLKIIVIFTIWDGNANSENEKLQNTKRSVERYRRFKNLERFFGVLALGASSRAGDINNLPWKIYVS